MRITSHLFEAFLKCETKCWLRAAGEQGAHFTKSQPPVVKHEAVDEQVADGGEVD